MTYDDLDYIQRLTDAGLLRTPVLELGTGWGGATSKEIIERTGMRYIGTDLEPGPGVDIVADFEDPAQMERFSGLGQFGSVLVLNVLEHAFDPIRVLDHAISLLRPSGTCVVITPAVWPLHNFPMDAWRILPNFYEEYSRRRKLELDRDYFEYVGLGPVTRFLEGANYSFPKPVKSRSRYFYGRLIHKAFNTYGRSMFQPSHIAVGALFHNTTTL